MDARGASVLLRTSGFTIIELMITIVILAVLSSIAAPAFREMMVASRVRSAASDLYETVLLARSEAIKRNAAIDIVPSGGNWAGGWTVQVTSDGTVLSTHEALDAVTVTANSSGNLSFRLDGRVSTNVRQMVLYTGEYATIQARCVYIDAAGRPSVRTDKDGNAANGCV
ncbi:MAG: GspH/FimT family pseudopilin [Betaproteobacteria bacterium]|nr:GspH/FimT family pseudopilin [Betaproteobacteria bacterium]MBI2961727.1 GspH/FimT family pseudopilin [Betaproteobacteria bacterium]